jgi:hypothetical protein
MRGGLQAGPSVGLEGSDGRPVPSPQPQTLVAMTTRPPFQASEGNLHFNGDIIRIKGLGLEGTEPSDWHHTPLGIKISPSQSPGRLQNQSTPLPQSPLATSSLQNTPYLGGRVSPLPRWGHCVPEYRKDLFKIPQ